jgi:hypothetical protein
MAPYSARPSNGSSQFGGATVQRPYMPPETKVQSSPTGSVHPQNAAPVIRSTVHFSVTPDLPEVAAYAEGRGWKQQCWTSLMITWQELRWTTDGWATTHVLSSTDVPCPVMSGLFYLPGVPAGTPVEFAVHAGIGCRDPADTALVRAEGELWFNDGGKNYRQVTQ